VWPETFWKNDQNAQKATKIKFQLGRKNCPTNFLKMYKKLYKLKMYKKLYKFKMYKKLYIRIWQVNIIIKLGIVFPKLQNVAWSGSTCHLHFRFDHAPPRPVFQGHEDGDSCWAATVLTMASSNSKFHNAKISFVGMIICSTRPIVEHSTKFRTDIFSNIYLTPPTWPHPIGLFFF
jgi:hypothetical protein